MEKKTNSYERKQKVVPKLIPIGCWGCGKTLWLPEDFVGCPYCGECTAGSSSIYTGTVKLPVKE
jgi:hypothetical protein